MVKCLKKLSYIVTMSGILGTIVYGITCLYLYNQHIMLTVGCILAGFGGTCVCGILIYAFGELLEDVKRIADLLNK